MRSLAWCAVLFLSGPASPARLHGQTLQEQGSVPPGDQRVQVFADGNVKNVISQPQDITAATGSLGLRYLRGSYVVTGIINVAGSADTLTSGFGASLLPLATGGALNAGLLDIRRNRLFCGTAALENPSSQGSAPQDDGFLCKIGLHVYGSVSSRRWATTLDTVGLPTATVDVPTWATGTGLSYQFFNGEIGDSGQDPTPVSMVFDVALTTRHIRGDLFDADSTRRAILNDDRRNFVGLELGLGLQYNQIRAGLNYYFLNGDVNGLSNGQVVAGVSIQANLNSGRLRRTGESPPPDKALSPVDTTSSPEPVEPDTTASQ